MKEAVVEVEEATKVAAVKEAEEVMKEVAAVAEEVAMKEAEEVIIIITDTRLILYSIFGGF